MDKKMFSLLMVLLCTSCAKLQYLDQALTLKDYSDEQAAMKQDVAKQQERIMHLLDRAASGDKLNDLLTRDDLLREVGFPVLVEKDAAYAAERWLYRNPVKYINTAKVYFVIESSGKVKEWQYVPAESP